MNILAIDLGYGHVKVAIGNKVFKFPTAVSRVKGGAVSGFGNESSMSFNSVNYHVGEAAFLNARTTRDFDFLIEFGPLLVAEAIRLAGVRFDSIHSIVTGISIMNWNRKEEFRKSLMKFVVNGRGYKFNKVFIRAQGEGIMINENAMAGNVCVVDTGYNTLDFLVFKDSKPNPSASFANTFGVNQVVTEVKSILEVKTGLNMREQEVNKYMSVGFALIGGEKVDVNEISNPIKKDYVSQILTDLRAEKKEFLMRADKVIFAGGGSFLFVDQKLPKNCSIAKQADFSNVLGYLKSV